MHTMFEPHHSIRFYAEKWNSSDDTVRRMFQDLPGVMKLGEPKRGKRTRSELRIPESVAYARYKEKTR